jgi:glycosyltransferase involved in cell wall biosynthesis
VCNAWQQNAFPGARIVPVGIDVDAIPFIEDPLPGLGRFSREPYLAFCHKIHVNKGYDLALEVGRRAGMAVHFAGERFADVALERYHGEIDSDAQLYEFVGCAVGLLSPCRLDAGGRVNLEAAACGTPVVCLDWTGTREHVAHCVSGFVCRDTDEMVEAVADLPQLDRVRCREWVADTHGIERMIETLLTWCAAARDGEAW